MPWWDVTCALSIDREFIISFAMVVAMLVSIHTLNRPVFLLYATTPDYLFNVFCFSASTTTFSPATLNPFLLLTLSTYRLATFSRSANSPKSSSWSSVNGTQKGSSSSISNPAKRNCGLADPELRFLISSLKPKDSATGRSALIVKVCDPVVDAEEVDESVSDRMVPRRRVKTA